MDSGCSDIFVLGAVYIFSYLLTDCRRAVRYRLCIRSSALKHLAVYVRQSVQSGDRRSDALMWNEACNQYQFYFMYQPYAPVSGRAPIDVLFNTKLAYAVYNVYTGHAWYTPFDDGSNSTSSTTHSYTAYNSVRIERWGPYIPD